MVGVASRSVERNGPVNGHSVSSVIEHFAADDKPPVEDPAAVQPSRNGATQAAANDNAEARQEALATTGTAAKAEREKNAAPVITSDTKPAKGKTSKRTSRPPKFSYVPQARLDAEVARLEELSRSALSGDTTALDTLRGELDHVPHVWRRLGDLQYMIEQELIQLIAGKDPLKAECFRKRCSELRYELLDRESCSLATEMAASRVVTTFGFVQLLELRALQTPDDLRNIKQLEQAERRFQAAMRTFLMTKRSELQLGQLAS